MASEVSSMPNGNYAPQQHGFDQQQANNAYASNYNQAPSTSNGPAPSANAQPEIPKDEVGWYFVEQYYTTLSRTPEKLYVSLLRIAVRVGTGADCWILALLQQALPVRVRKRDRQGAGLRWPEGKLHKITWRTCQFTNTSQAINDRIKELEFQDCKVRITNVDSQASDINIVIQVIGEISNKSQPHRKFTQTFVLATQTNGYFVLNDIFRYMIEEEEETAAAEPTKAEEVEEVQQEPAAEASAVQEPAPAAEESQPKTLTSSEDKSAVEQDAQIVDKELKEKVLEPAQEQAKEEPKVEQSAPAVNGAEEPKEEAAAEEPAAEEAPAEVEQEKPRDPEPTPVSEEPPKPAAKPAAPAPVKPAVPKTWASLAASANKSVAMPAAPSAAPTTAPAQSAKPAAAAKSAPTATPTQSSATSTSTSAPAAQREASPTAASGDEWTAVSGSHNRQQSRQVNGQQQQQQEPSHPRGYIKNVQENIKGPEMKEKLAQFGEINYFDIYRAKV
jgi:hypothetical protein